MDRTELTRHRVLVVEDSEEDREAIERALRQSHPHLCLEFVTDGATALSRLHGPDGQPTLVLLDLNMPGMHGHQLLEQLRADPATNALRIVVFTSSTTAADIDRCYAAGADSYIYKPVDFTLFRTVLQNTIDYWITG